MATPQSQKSPKRLRRRKKSSKKFSLSYSLLLLSAMIFVGVMTGMAAYNFGKQAVEGVNPSPTGVKLPKSSPIIKPKESPKSSPQGQADAKTSFFLDETSVIQAMKVRSQQDLGGLTRPNFVAKANNDRKLSDRKSMYVRVDRIYDSMRDPLAISANSDEKINERIAALRQRVYASREIDDSIISIGRPSRREYDDLSLLNSKKIDPDKVRAVSENSEFNPKPVNSFFISDRQKPSR